MQSDVVSYIFPHVDSGSLLKATVKGTEVKSQVCRCSNSFWLEIEGGGGTKVCNRLILLG